METCAFASGNQVSGVTGARGNRYFIPTGRSSVQVRCNSQQEEQQQPEPDFNDISGLADLNDSRGETITPRFVPTYSRIGRRGFAKRYELFPGGPVDLGLDKDDDKDDEQSSIDSMKPRVPEEIMDVPKGPTHREMIAARRHYLKRQARRGIFQQAKLLRNRFPDDSL